MHPFLLCDGELLSLVYEMDNFLAQINGMPGVKADFLTRVEGVPVDRDKVATVARLEPYHRAAVEGLGFSWEQCWRAEQVHGADVAVVKRDEPARVMGGVDGLLTGDAGVLLGIYAADCGAVYLYDEHSGALGLLHSGKKGTELGVLSKALKLMKAEFGTRADNVIVALAPCIRPPAYEVDFAAEIKRQALEAGVSEENFTDCGVCTSENLEKFYSYRMEKGATGRMMALLGRSENA